MNMISVHDIKEAALDFYTGLQEGLMFFFCSG
jgi:hypothetical protein